MIAVLLSVFVITNNFFDFIYFFENWFVIHKAGNAQVSVFLSDGQ